MALPYLSSSACFLHTCKNSCCRSSHLQLTCSHSPSPLLYSPGSTDFCFPHISASFSFFNLLYFLQALCFALLFFCTFRVTHGLFFTIPTALGIVSSITSFRLFFNKFQLSFTLASFVLLSRSFPLIFNLTRS